MFWAVGRPFAEAGAQGAMWGNPWGDAGKGPRQRELVFVEHQFCARHSGKHCAYVISFNSYNKPIR